MSGHGSDSSKRPVRAAVSLPRCSLWNYSATMDFSGSADAAACDFPTVVPGRWSFPRQMPDQKVNRVGKQ